MDDAELAFSTAHQLILKLAKHKAKVSPDPPQVKANLFSKIIFSGMILINSGTVF